MTATPVDHSQSVSMLRLTAEHLKKVTFPQLVRPALGPNAPPTIELIQWAIQAYSFPWIRHMSALINGIILYHLPPNARQISCASPHGRILYGDCRSMTQDKLQMLAFPN